MTRKISTALILAVIVIAAAGLRLRRITAPPTDFPADRQITTALLIEAWTGGRPLEAYKFQHHAKSGRDDPRVLMPEAPIVPWLAAKTARIFRSEFRVPSSGFPVPSSEFRVPSSGLKTHGSGSATSESAIPSSQSAIPNPESRVPNLDVNPSSLQYGRLTAPFALARLWTVAFSLAILLMIFDLGRRWFSSRVGLFAAGAFAFLPASFYFSRAVIPDVPMTAFMLAALCAADRMSECRVKAGEKITGRVLLWALLAAVAVSLAILAKLYGAIIILVIFFMPCDWESPRRTWEIHTGNRKFLLLWLVLLALGASCAIFGYYPLSPFSLAHDLEKLSAGTNSVMDTFGAYGMRMRYVKVFINRLDLLMTGGGALLALAGMALALARRERFAQRLGMWLLNMALFCYLFNGANTYWFFMLLPPACLAIGYALSAALNWARVGQSPTALSEPQTRGWSWARRALTGGLLTAAIATSLLFSPAPAKIWREYWQADYSILNAGAFVHAQTTPSTRLAAVGDVPFDLLWASGRQGVSVRRDDDNHLEATSNTWTQAASFRPAEGWAAQWLFQHYHCEAGATGVAIFGALNPKIIPVSETRKDWRIFFNPLSPPSMGLALSLAGAALTTRTLPGNPVGSKPTHLEIWLRYEIWAPNSKGYQDLARGLRYAAVRLRNHNLINGGAWRLPPLKGAINYPGEDYSSGQIGGAVSECEVTSQPENKGTQIAPRYVVTHWLFAVPEHFPPGVYEVEIASGHIGHSLREDNPEHEIEWTSIGPIQITPGAAVEEGALRGALYCRNAEYGAGPDVGPDSSVMISSADGPLYLDPGTCEKPRHLEFRYELMNKPEKDESVEINVSCQYKAGAASANADLANDHYFQRKSGTLRLEIPAEGERLPGRPDVRTGVEEGISIVVYDHRSEEMKAEVNWPLYVDEIHSEPPVVRLSDFRIIGDTPRK
ncbi:MAG: phospholipid carrier-dependent glycosyltransferase [Candidatus Sumerlaeota bacterium]|nr:phospholipid carrier-dependent glycosyltransferase [Candidatus Sumerlaeota bacterium]